jgi:hypothetical protein
MLSISLLFLPSVVPNQRQLSSVVSDWGSYLSCDFPLGFCGELFPVYLFSCLTELWSFVFLLCYYVAVFQFIQNHESLPRCTLVS